MNLRFARLGKHEKCAKFDTSNNHPGICAKSLQRARMINDCNAGATVAHSPIVLDLVLALQQ
jgi:hypothetical protein